MPRILYFSRDYTTHDHRFLSALANTEYHVDYLRLERRGHQMEDRSLPTEIALVPWVGGQRPAKLGDGLRLLSALRRVIRDLQPDLILSGPIQRSAFLVALSGFHPLVSMSWGYDLLYDVERGATWRWATRYTLRHSAALVGDCATIRQKAIQYGMPAARIVTFPWGVDIQHFTPNPVKRSELDIFTLLSTRGWEPIYGVDCIARAFVKAAQERPELRLMMLGSGSQAPMLHQIFIQGGVQDRVLFPGQVSQSDLPRYYRMADLYVSASHSDGTSISLLEAMACGKPVLVSDIPGNKEWVTPGENGWWFPDGDHNALSQIILQAIKQRENLAVMGQNSRRIAEQRADWSNNFPQLLRAFEIAWQS
jgi:glycosyltransferase involved in cell wall biosynthesis